MSQRLSTEPPGAGRFDAAGPLLALYRRTRRSAGEIRRTVPGLVAMVPRLATVSLQKLRGRADYARWSNPENLEQWWDSRTQTIAALIPPGSRVIEFGAGRCQLRRYLPPGCSYVPSDLAPREPGTIVCDLNRRPLPDLRHVAATVAVFGGVLEYMSDVPSLVRWLSGQTSMVVASYDHTKTGAGPWARLTELLRRRNFGYHNNYTLEQLTALFAGEGFRCVRTEQWQTQTILVLEGGRQAEDGFAIPSEATGRS
jgi:hypothetical protein